MKKGNNIDLDYGANPNPMNERKQVALLFGAGFSAPAGLPTARILNKNLKSLSESYLNNSNNIRNTDVYSQDKDKNARKLLFEIISLYSREFECFDYEEFYDFLHSSSVRVGRYEEVINKFVTERITLGDYVCCITEIYNKLINSLLTIPYNNLDVYDGLEDFLSHVARQYVINVHTLNHDLLFEQLIETANLQLNFSDGFTEIGSPYYGIYENKEYNERYHCRLARFTNNYKDKAIRLYKLHGSLNYVLHSRAKESIVLEPDACLKIPLGINYKIILEEIEGKDEYGVYPFAEHPYFLSGTNTKCKMYGDSLIWRRLQENFKQNLRKANCLIIIGYGCKDKVINESIKKNLGNVSKKVYLIDPKPSENVSAFAREIKAEIIKMGVGEVDFSQFNL